jgi:spore germination cell wall hydrolase CwlJ-like protein
MRIPHLVAWFLTLGSLIGVTACGHSSLSSRSERSCLARAMYFESIRSSDEGMLAVGTVVMNRVESGEYPRSVCGVVGQKNQFAPGVLTKPMQEGRSRERAERVAAAVLSGKRHPAVGKAMFFHTAGRTYRYSNMHYVLVAGGNAFYERRPTRRSYIPRTVIASAGPTDSITARGGWFDRSRSVTMPEQYIAAAPSAPQRHTRVPEPRVMAIAQVPRPAPVAIVSPAPEPAPAQLSIEGLILADAGLPY